MCNLTAVSITDDDFCEKCQLTFKLEALITKQFTTDQNGVNYVRVQHIENLIKELECSI